VGDPDYSFTSACGRGELLLTNTVLERGRGMKNETVVELWVYKKVKDSSGEGFLSGEKSEDYCDPEGLFSANRESWHKKEPKHKSLAGSEISERNTILHNKNGKKGGKITFTIPSSTRAKKSKTVRRNLVCLVSTGGGEKAKNSTSL